MAGFDEFVAEVLISPFCGWTAPLPWHYSVRVAALSRSTQAMLDMFTTGGEGLSQLADRAPRTVTTEAWPPSVPVAPRRLLPLGIPVIQKEAATDNMGQDEANDGSRLPFRDGSLDLYATGTSHFSLSIQPRSRARQHLRDPAGVDGLIS